MAGVFTSSVTTTGAAASFTILVVGAAVFSFLEAIGAVDAICAEAVAGAEVLVSDFVCLTICFVIYYYNNFYLSILTHNIY